MAYLKRGPKGPKKLNGRKKRAKPNLSGIQQGVGRTTNRAFGGPGIKSQTPTAALNAFSPYHLGLPRAIGPYTVVRFTMRVNLDRAITILGTFREDRGETGRPAWSSLVGVQSNIPATAINGTNNGFGIEMPALKSLGNATLVPSAYSVQIMNPEAVQTTTGILYIGRSTAMLNAVNDTQPWTDLGENFVSYQAPRLCSAAKLAFRGVHIDAIPQNMSSLSNFLPMEVFGGATAEPTITWNLGGSANIYSGTPSGFTPIVIYNPSNVGLEVLICLEARIRFDLTNPAASSHVHHKMAPDSQWDNVITRMSKDGAGVKDIADKVAELGEAPVMPFG